MTCNDSNCLILDNSSAYEKKLITCNSPYCNFVCHAKCAGLAIKKQKDIDSLYFICKKCEEFLRFSSNFTTAKITALETLITDKIGNIEAAVNKLETRINILEGEIKPEKYDDKFNALNKKVERTQTDYNTHTELLNALENKVKVCPKT